MNIRDEIAAELDGTQYPVRISKELNQRAKDAGVVIVYGASDDLMEFNGAIHDEIDAYDGTTAYLTKAGLLTKECDDEYYPHFAKLKDSAVTIAALFDASGYTFIYETSIPHKTFEVGEDGDKYCRGIVFNLSDATP